MAAPVQIVWSFDTTGSMSSCLQAVKHQIKDMSARLLKDIPGLEIGLIAHGDYCDQHSSYLVRTMPFSRDPQAISEWVQATGATGGGDAPEAYEIALRAAKLDFAWRPDARKVLALIGDEIPHGPDFPANTDHVDWEQELEALGQLGVRCFGVQCLNNARASFFYKALAERTDGMWLPMKDLQIIRDAFLAVCLQVADTTAFEQFRSQLAESGPVASALVPLMLRLAKKKKMSGEELSALTGVVAKLASEHGRPPNESFLPIDGVEVSAFVRESSYEVELVQNFTNKGDFAGKGTSFEYRFALPTSAAVFYFEAQLSSGRRIVGVVKGREEARREYQKAISQGKKAFLMEEKNAVILAMELGNLQPDESVKITLRYIMEPEEISLRTLRLRLPQHVAPRSGSKAVSGMLTCYPITVNIFSEGVRNMSSLSYSDHFQLIKPTLPDWSSCGRLALKPEDGLLNGDLVFDMELCEPLPSFRVAVERCEELKSTMIRAVMRRSSAETKQHSGKHIALVLDASCSMQGDSFRDAKASALELLRALGKAEEPVCSCLIMRQKTEVLCESLEAVAASAALEASGQSCGGGSDFGKALDAALALTRKPDAIIFISDGQGPESLEPIFTKARDANVRIFCLGVGRDPGAELLEGLAAVGCGTSQLLAHGSEISSAAHRMAADLMVEATELKVEVAGWEHEQWPMRTFAYPDHVAVAYVRLKTLDTKDVSIRVNGEDIPLPAEPVTVGRRLHRLGARSRILELERLNTNGAQNSTIAALAEEQGLTSSQTSFVAVEESDLDLSVPKTSAEDVGSSAQSAETISDAHSSSRRRSPASSDRSCRIRARKHSRRSFDEDESLESSYSDDRLRRSESGYSEEEEEDDTDDEPPPGFFEARPGKRVSVSAEAYGGWDTKEASVVPVIAKSDEPLRGAGDLYCADSAADDLLCAGVADLHEGGGGLKSFFGSLATRMDDVGRMDESCSLMNLECASLKAASCDLRMPARGMKAKKMKKGPMLPSASAAVASAGKAMSTVMGSMKSGMSKVLSHRNSSSTIAEEKAAASVPPLPVLPSGLGNFYEGTIMHEAFGSKAHQLVLKVDAEDASGTMPGRYTGRWYSMNQIETVFVEFASGSTDVRIWNEDGAGKTELRGTVDTATGRISGTCIQGGISAGSFELAPPRGPARVELTDSDGDALVFIRLLHGGVAEYYNGKLVIASMRTFKFNARTGFCSDEDGTFTVPDGPVPRSSILADLKALFVTAGVSVEETI